MKRVCVIGAGPGGLTAALYLAKKGIVVDIYESDPKYLGGISRTEEYKSYKFDIGGHRFYTKNKEIEDFWKDTLGTNFLVRPRKSRILFEGKYYDYPLKIGNALKNLGIMRSLHAILSYARYLIRPIAPEKTYADWMTNKFGKVLFTLFFKNYTEKIWGISVESISKDWAIQRVKTFSLGGAIVSALFPWKKKNFKTLTEKFYYPKLGPGMMWDTIGQQCKQFGVNIYMNSSIRKIEQVSSGVWKVTTDKAIPIEYTNIISTMPLTHLIQALAISKPHHVQVAAQNLKYRDFITILLIIDKPYIFDDNWIYVHNPEVKVGRIQNFKNWSPHMVPDSQKTSLGFEYFIFEKDSLWNLPDKDFLELAKSEAVTLGLCTYEDITDGTVVKVKKAYPVYNSDYQTNVNILRDYLKEFNGIKTIGRNGMHKWNNQDHSMMSALIAAQSILGETKLDEWIVNTDANYGEESVRQTPTTL